MGVIRFGEWRDPRPRAHLLARGPPREGVGDVGLGEVGGSHADAGETLGCSELMLSAGRPCPGDERSPECQPSVGRRPSVAGSRASCLTLLDLADWGLKAWESSRMSPNKGEQWSFTDRETEGGV